MSRARSAVCTAGAALALAIGCNGSQGTIGAVLSQSPDGELTIHAAPEGLGADRAGLKPGDQILLIDGIDVRRLSAERVHELLSGEVGETVKLTLVRGEEVIRVTVERTPARKWTNRRKQDEPEQ